LTPKKRKPKFSDVPILIDTREGKPYKFANSRKVALKTGDYSLEGFEQRVVIERKTKADIYGSVSQHRARFEREFKRMAKYDYAAVVIEASLHDLLIRPRFSKMNPKSVINTLISWSVKYKVHIFLAQNRRYGRTITYRILEKFYQHVKSAKKGKTDCRAKMSGNNIKPKS